MRILYKFFKIFQKSLLSKFLLNVTATNRNSGDLIGNIFWCFPPEPKSWVRPWYQVYKCIRHSCLFHICLSHSGGTKILVWGRGNIRQNFIHEFLSSPVLQWRRQKFSSEKTFSENVLIKDFLKTFRKIYKTICTKI